MRMSQILDKIEKILNKNKVIIADGGFSNQLRKYDFEFNSNPLWTFKAILEKPELIKQVHKDYLNAGSKIITTNSYQATFQKLKELNYNDKEIKNYLKLSLSLAKEAIEEYSKENTFNNIEPLIAFSIGSYGAYLCNFEEYRGNYNLNENELIDFHKERIDFFAEELFENKHILAIETIPNYTEAVAIIKLIQKYDNLKAWISFTMKNESEISDGTHIKKLIDLVENVEQVIAVGANCFSLKFLPGILENLKKYNKKKLTIIYPNNEYEIDSIDNRKLDFVNEIEKNKNNFKIVGGCCGVTPEHIKNICKIFV